MHEHITVNVVKLKHTNAVLKTAYFEENSKCSINVPNKF